MSEEQRAWMQEELGRLNRELTQMNERNEQLETALNRALGVLRHLRHPFWCEVEAVLNNRAAAGSKAS